MRTTFDRKLEKKQTNIGLTCLTLLLAMTASGRIVGSVRGSSVQEVQAYAVYMEASPPEQITEKQLIMNHIVEVFGDDAPEAFDLLECENKELNPHAVNDNRTWGGVGRDRGIFQINDVYHPLTDAQAFDYKQNINYAHRMYLNDDRTFIRWTCGR